MHLKTLTLRGFKSFASSTTFRLEPGVTCIVGPNGSGKSNIVDAIAWVLGEQGAKSLRGGKMEDVIFAGTPGRPPLGRAEVVLTIDNTDGALPIEFTEVTVSRLMYRSGESEYAINGTPCRLLDVQELLSDSGIGRELHVIVGQGQLDAVLAARPEERRAFIEEAAGVLKHRKRKEKALRKLDAMAANLARLTDLTAELRRQLKPLGRQAEVARKAASIQAELRDCRLRLLAEDLGILREALAAELADEEALRERRAGVEAALAELRARETRLEHQLAADSPAHAAAQETWYRLAAVRERLRSVATLADERRRHFAGDFEQLPLGPDPDDLEAEAARLRDEHAALGEQLATERARLAVAEAAREQAEQSLAVEEAALVSAVRASADLREGRARLAGEAAAARTRVEAAELEVARLAAAATDATTRAEQARTELLALETEMASLGVGEVELDTEHEVAITRLTSAESRLAELSAQEHEADRERVGLAARVEALRLALRRRGGAAELVEAGMAGVLGPVADLITVQAGYERAVAAALGAAVDAVAVESADVAVEALAWLRSAGAGRAAVVYPDVAASADNLPAGLQPVADAVSAPVGVIDAVRRVLSDAVVARDIDEARRIAAEHPRLRVVTSTGDVVAAGWAEGGGSSGTSIIELRAVLDDAESRLAAAGAACERLRFERATAAAERDSAAEHAEAALERLHDSDAAMGAVAERLAQIGSMARAASAEAERLQSAVSHAGAELESHRRRLEELVARGTAAEDEDVDYEPSTIERDRLASECSAARAAEVDARLAVRTVEERAQALLARADELTAAAEATRAERTEAIERRRRRHAAADVAAAVADVARLALQKVELSLELAAHERDELAAARTRSEAELLSTRTEARELDTELAGLTDSVHRDEVALAEQRLRIEALENRCIEEFGLPPDDVVVDYGPANAVPPPPDAGENAVATPYDREVVERRARSAERALALLGKVNPLALEEFSALEERHAFLSSQLDDLKATRRDLLTVIHDVDVRIEEMFRSAYDDTAREFATVFSMLFPGGTGRLVLTEPDDMLTTGVEVEARPAGKSVKRLSLLSGGERSLTAIALLFAIFRARPSPFYVLDEVEAALDDTNLGRLIDCLRGLSSDSQLVVVTHQKKTMEAADALYGVSMRGDGVTAVISQRLRQPDLVS